MRQADTNALHVSAARWPRGTLSATRQAKHFFAFTLEIGNLVKQQFFVEEMRKNSTAGYQCGQNPLGGTQQHHKVVAGG